MRIWVCLDAKLTFFPHHPLPLRWLKEIRGILCLHPHGHIEPVVAARLSTAAQVRAPLSAKDSIWNWTQYFGRLLGMKKEAWRALRLATVIRKFFKNEVLCSYSQETFNLLTVNFQGNHLACIYPFLNFTHIGHLIHTIPLMRSVSDHFKDKRKLRERSNSFKIKEKE